MKHHRVDVLVVGAGPVGLALAALLARAGIDTLVLAAGAEDEVSALPATLPLQPAMQMVLRDLGLLGRLAPDAAMPASVDHAHLLALLRAEARRLGAELRFETEVLTLHHDERAAYAWVHEPRGGNTELIADYLIGADDQGLIAQRHRGRIFRLGPARALAAGGEALAAGLAEALRLAWRLALVIKGQAESDVLDGYARECEDAANATYVPAAPLRLGRESASTHDVIGKGCFTLLTGPGGQCWRAAAQRQADELGIEISVVGIGPGEEADDISGSWARQRGIGADGCLLVRPDGQIALRAATRSAAANELLGAALRRQLGRLQVASLT